MLGTVVSPSWNLFFFFKFWFAELLKLSWYLNKFFFLLLDSLKLPWFFSSFLIALDLQILCPANLWSSWGLDIIDILGLLPMYNSLLKWIILTACISLCTGNSHIYHLHLEVLKVFFQSWYIQFFATRNQFPLKSALSQQIPPANLFFPYQFYQLIYRFNLRNIIKINYFFPSFSLH